MKDYKLQARVVFRTYSKENYPYDTGIISSIIIDESITIYEIIPDEMEFERVYRSSKEIISIKS